MLPGEDPVAHLAKRIKYRKVFKPLNDVEADLVDRIAGENWILDRIDKACVAQVAHDVRNLSLAQELADGAQVAECSRRLLYNLTATTPLQTEDLFGGPDHPTRLRATLESTVAGCDWLLGRFHRLHQHLDAPDAWHLRDGYEFVRLLGHFIGEMADEDDVAVVLLASQCLAADALPTMSDQAITDGLEAVLNTKRGRALVAAVVQNGDGLEPDGDTEAEPDPDLDVEVDAFDRANGLVHGVLGLWDADPQGTDAPLMERFLPRDTPSARRRLADLIAEQTKRIQQIRAFRASVAAANAAEAASRLVGSPGPEGPLLNRYATSHGRMYQNAINTLIKTRKAFLDGTFDPTVANDDDDDDIIAAAAQAVANANGTAGTRPRIGRSFPLNRGRPGTVSALDHGQHRHRKCLHALCLGRGWQITKQSQTRARSAGQGARTRARTAAERPRHNRRKRTIRAAAGATGTDRRRSAAATIDPQRRACATAPRRPGHWPESADRDRAQAIASPRSVAVSAAADRRGRLATRPEARPDQLPALSVVLPHVEDRLRREQPRRVYPEVRSRTAALLTPPTGTAPSRIRRQIAPIRTVCLFL